MVLVKFIVSYVILIQLSKISGENIRTFYAQQIIDENQVGQLKLSSRLAPDEARQSEIKGTEDCDITVGIVGGGMSGLYTALLLQSLGIKQQLYEANPERFGGRIYTHYFNKEEWERSSPGQPEYYKYFDVGAMRYPVLDTHKRVIGNQRWSLFNFLNRWNGPKYKLRIIPYKFDDPNTLKYYNYVKKHSHEVKNNPGRDHFQFSITNGGIVPDVYLTKPHTFWLKKAFNPFLNSLEKDFKTGYKKLKKFDHLSNRGFLSTFNDTEYEFFRDQIPYPNVVIDYLETMDSGTGFYEGSFTENVIDMYDFDHPGPGEDKWLCIEGGSSRIVNAMVNLIRTKPLLDHEVTKIGLDTVNGKVELHFEKQPPQKFDHVIMALPFNKFQKIDFINEKLSMSKQMAFRMLNFENSMKVGLQFRHRWWEDPHYMKGKPIKGGSSSTDLPIRTIVYPSYGTHLNSSAAAVLIGSYTWGHDSHRFGMMNDSEIIELVLNNMEEIHGPVVKEEFTGEYYVHNWGEDEFVGGAFAFFRPSQFSTHFYPSIKPELNGRLHFAGETFSINHAWVVGALSSAHRAVYEILIREGFTGKIAELERKWGKLDEPYV